MSSDEDCCILPSKPSYSTVVSGQSKMNSDRVPKFTCPMCPQVCEELCIMEAHIENEHLNDMDEQISKDTSKPFSSAVHSCPLCSQTFKDTLLLESHFRIEHDVLQNEEPTSQVQIQILSCPVCFSEFYSEELLAQHVNLHFSTDIPNDADEELARKLDQEERFLMENKERDDFKRLQSMHGFDQGRSLNRQCDANLFKSVEKGNMSAVDYHEKRIMLKMSEKIGLDDGSSATLDITNHIRKLAVVQSANMCSAVDHYAASFGDSGWGCGYRNLQMLLSALLRSPQYADRLVNLCPSTSTASDNSIKVPSISRLQSAIEEAWKMGFDEQGCEQLGGKLSGTCKWIGATEIATLLASCRIRYRLIDFHRPTSPDGKLHPALFDWVKKYFEETSEFKPPLYFQHQGHSRTIIGIEETTQGKARLLILDPSHKSDQMRLLTNISGSAQNKPAIAKKILVPMAALKAKQYQIVCADGGFADSEQEYLQSRVIRSTRIP
ncbi:zinc finger-containing ubiquitin peptidase 1-like [Daphnia carinata]|uniref:zinc finger-containing ubiquitin peptidase 1-like n=1 Tax=Daphnia carinata TaxID=120202 RepID=UPI00257A79E1|nr:zinc finger-containing ubiquitin peptidase 1-like [Daphnia carinata]